MRHIDNDQAQHLLLLIQDILIKRDGATAALVVAAVHPDDADRICFSAADGKVWPIELCIRSSEAHLRVYEVSRDGTLGTVFRQFDICRDGEILDVDKVTTMLDALLGHMHPVLDELCALPSPPAGPGAGGA